MINDLDLLRRCFAELCFKPEDGTQITPATTLKELEISELDKAELVMEIEHKFDFEFTDDQTEGWRKVGDILKSIEEARFML